MLELLTRIVLLSIQYEMGCCVHTYHTGVYVKHHNFVLPRSSCRILYWSSKHNDVCRVGDVLGLRFYTLFVNFNQ